MNSQIESTIPQIFIDFFLGGSSGILTKTPLCIFQELQFLIMIGAQYEKKNYNVGILEGCKNLIKNGLLMRQIRKNTNIFRYSLVQAFNFSIFDAQNRLFLLNIDKSKQLIKYFIGSLMIGGNAGIFSLIIFYPLDFTKVRLVNNQIKATKQQQTFFHILKDLYKGFCMSAISIFIYRGLYFGGYNTGKYIMWGNDEYQRKQFNFRNFFLAQFIVCFSEAFVHPLDKIRIDLILKSGSNSQAGVSGSSLYTFNQKGLRELFKGYYPFKLRYLCQSTQLLVYDGLQQCFNQKMQY